MTKMSRESAAGAARSADEELVLALDQGGHSSRAIAFDASGRVLARSSRAVAEQRIGEDRVEQDAEELVQSLFDAAGETLAELGPRAPHVARAGLATQRSSLVCWDRESGVALSPVISWQDRRAAAWLDGFARDAEEVHRRTGLFLSPHYGASKLAWCLENLPDVARARERGRLALGPLASFLAFRLLRERPFVVDPANASRTLLYSLAEHDWDPFLCTRFGIPEELLPGCVPTRDSFGTFTAGGVEIPLCVLTGDQSAAIFAQGVPHSGTAYVNLGTGAFVQRPFTGELVLLPRLLTSIVSGASRDGGSAARLEVASENRTQDLAQGRPQHRREHRRGGSTFVIEGTINGSGSALRWIAAELGLRDVETELDGWLGTRRNPPLFLNGVSGLAAPYWAPRFASRFIGGGTPEERVVAVAESILFLVKIILDEMESVLPPARRLWVSGGLAQSDALCGLLADASALPVERSLDPEATARGLAWQTFGRGKCWLETGARTFAPRADASLAGRQARFRCELERALGLEP